MLDSTTLANMVSMLVVSAKQELIIKTLVDAKLLTYEQVDRFVEIAINNFKQEMQTMQKEHQEQLQQYKKDQQNKKDEAMDKLQKDLLAKIPTDKIGKA